MNTGPRHVGRLTKYNTLTGNTWGVLSPVFTRNHPPGTRPGERGIAMGPFLRKWLWDRSGFILAALVLGSLVLGWIFPATQDAVMSFAFGQIIMAIVVLIKESMSFSRA